MMHDDPLFSVCESVSVTKAERGVSLSAGYLLLREKNIKLVLLVLDTFNPRLQPNFCALLDIGTVPDPSSICHLWKAFDINPNIVHTRKSVLDQ
ncbi:hypothetical protein EDB87DRAFT_1624850 [Lactarius vividus]|nr:hypothetical protein EDB87DRAFT_1624850 [Lactarius vividus]